LISKITCRLPSFGKPASAETRPEPMEVDVPGQSWGGVTTEQFGLRLLSILASAPTNALSPAESAGSVQKLALLSNKTTAILSDCGVASFVLASCQAETKSPTASRNASIFGSGSPPRVELAMLPDLSRTRNASTPGLSLKHRKCSLSPPTLVPSTLRVAGQSTPGMPLQSLREPGTKNGLPPEQFAVIIERLK